MNKSYVDPEFVIFTGPMFGSKTTRLLAVVDRYQRQNRSVIAFKPSIDTRYTKSNITTHNGGAVPAICVNSGDCVVQYIKRKNLLPDVVAVDEAFMIEGSADALITLYRTGVNVVVASIQMSFMGNPFHEIKEMMPWATHISVCPAVCPKSGADAYYTYKKKSDENEVAVGGSEMYEPRCLSQHDLIGKRRDQHARTIIS